MLEKSKGSNKNWTIPDTQVTGKTNYTKNLVQATRFWKTRLSRKLKVKRFESQLKVFGARKPKGLNKIAENK